MSADTLASKSAWIETADGFAHGRYRIVPVADASDHSWRLDIVCDAKPGDGSAVLVNAAECLTFSHACREAEKMELGRARHLRAATHVGLFFVSASIFLFAPTSPPSLSQYVIGLLALFVAFGSIGNVFGAVRPDVWGWQSKSPAPLEATALDRLYRRITSMHGASSHVAAVATPNVRVLHPASGHQPPTPR